MTLILDLTVFILKRSSSRHTLYVFCFLKNTYSFHSNILYSLFYIAHVAKRISSHPQLNNVIFWAIRGTAEPRKWNRPIIHILFLKIRAYWNIFYYGIYACSVPEVWSEDITAVCSSRYSEPWHRQTWQTDRRATRCITTPYWRLVKYYYMYTVFQKKTPTHIVGYKLRNSCLILIIFDIKIPDIIWHRMTA